MDITEQIMVGIQASKNKICPATFPKAIFKKLTGTSKDKKYVESMRSWCEGYYGRGPDLDPDWAPIVLPNEPTRGHKIVGFQSRGHKIVGFQSRSRTDNKWFEIQDPRGFTLEINASTMVSLMKDNVIDHGVVQEDCIWGYDHSPTLVSVDGQIYQDFLAAKTKKEALVKVNVKGLEIGKTYLSTSYGSETVHIYLGRAKVKINLSIGNGWHNSNNRREDRSANNLFLFATTNAYSKSYDYILKKTLPKLYQTTNQSQTLVSKFRQEIEKQQSFEYPSILLKDTNYNRDLKLKAFDCDDINISISN